MAFKMPNFLLYSARISSWWERRERVWRKTPKWLSPSKIVLDFVFCFFKHSGPLKDPLTWILQILPQDFTSIHGKLLLRHFDISKFFVSENLVYFNAKWSTAGKLHLIVNQHTFHDATFIFKACCYHCCC